jgi:two-component system chemotaxis response regulator CheB
MARRIVLIGGSLGATRVLQAVLGSLPADFPAPVAIVLHRGAETGPELCTQLARDAKMPVEQAFDKQPIEPGRVYVAPPGYHLLVDGGHFALSVDEPVQYARPSIDALFDSGAASRGADVIAVALTSASSEGAKGAAAVVARGGALAVQDPASAEARRLPEAVLAAAPSCAVLAPERIAPWLARLAAGEEGPPG